ncbi:transmembrane protein 220-like [Amphibalanus amphitrite]|uniref:transmembrane protein 220-like n=1 Tax=Amphibalanus amphitrite TaxID=1232801 RepID=UPI001C9149FE|nr:transmembrane protein 220-like [Amphibalanus amphitrite]
MTAVLDTALRGDRQVTSGSGGEPRMSSSADITVWRALSLLMASLLLVAGVSQIGSDHPCMWVPVYTVPAVLCFAVAIKLEFAGCLPWRVCYLVHTGCSLALLVLVLVQTLRAAYRSRTELRHQPLVALQAHQLSDSARDMAALIITLIWMKMTKHVSDSHARLVLSRHQTSRLLPGLLILALTVPGLLWLSC